MSGYPRTFWMSAPWAEPEEGHCIKYKWPLDRVKIAVSNTSDSDVLASGWESYGQLSRWLRVSNCCIKYKRYLVIAVLAEPEEGRCIKYKWPLDRVKIAVSNTSDSDVLASGWEFLTVYHVMPNKSCLVIISSSKLNPLLVFDTATS